MKLTINGFTYFVGVDYEMPQPWVLRDELGLVGTKRGCSIRFRRAVQVGAADLASRRRDEPGPS